MSNSNLFKEKKDACFVAFVSGTTDPHTLAEKFEISPLTVKKWIKSGKWEVSQKEESRLDKKIAVARKKALLASLEAYAEKPHDTALQSLVSMLKQEEKRNTPSKELNDHIVIFLDQMTDFMIEKGHSELLKQLQALTLDLANYFRIRNAN